jgi:hypothetical protein
VERIERIDSDLSGAVEPVVLRPLTPLEREEARERRERARKRRQAPKRPPADSSGTIDVRV